ncbi:MAG: tRNA (adenosine(37)-N6)-threonylcarbamoyltransferase complex ATPase subunit type 1 TsaE [Actinomycetota bacterium]|nr:tRNA (adenosine(37)-N6)-threonylcarbamoyltransferase complex ATPase subunit type 1 TsaE [Actinomycetota bacterium]
MLSFVTRAAGETRMLGEALAPELAPGDVIALGGELGAGKTVWVQGVAAGLGVSARVTSPTFTLAHEYRGRHRLLHVDVYRLESFGELVDLGFEEWLESNAIMVVEWGDAVGPLLPDHRLEVDIRLGDEPDERSLSFRPGGREWVAKLSRMHVTAQRLLAPPDAPPPA